jgi:hypothetical protein
MFEEVSLFVYGMVAAVILIAIVAYFYLPTLVGATQAQAEYAALRDAAPTLILAQDNKSVYVCINSTAPQRVLIQRFNMWIDAQKDCHINPGGQCVPQQHHGDRQSWPFCRWFLGNYKPGDNITVVLKSDRATVVKSYRVAVVAFPTKLYVVPYVQNVTQTVTAVATVTATGTVYNTVVSTVFVPGSTVYTTYYQLVPTYTTITATVVIQDPQYTSTITQWLCSNYVPQAAGQVSIVQGRYGFQPPTVTVTSTSTSTNTVTTTMTSYTTVTSYTTAYVTSYVTSTTTVTMPTYVWITYTTTMTTTVLSTVPGVWVICYVCLTNQQTRSCTTTTLVTTTRTITTITNNAGFAQTASGGESSAGRRLTADAFAMALSAVVMMAGSVMLAKRR